jgi:D-glycero-D-manno-heptose 1,7-bisphosphate phosphatase
MAGRATATARRKAVFIDRDGVIVRSPVRDGKPVAATRWEHIEILPGVEDALEALRAAGFLNIVVTNQPDIATGKQSVKSLAAIHDRLATRLAIDAIEVCPHVDADGCDCRKPKPGMLLGAARTHGIDLAASWMVGDRWRDVAAGQAAGCRACFIDYGYDEPRPSDPYYTIGSLAAAARLIVTANLEKHHA